MQNGRLGARVDLPVNTKHNHPIFAHLYALPIHTCRHASISIVYTASGQARGMRRKGHPCTQLLDGSLSIQAMKTKRLR
jgi:hypothetical protein